MSLIDQALRRIVAGHQATGCTRADCRLLAQHVKPWRIYRQGASWAGRGHVWRLEFDPTYEEAHECGVNSHYDSFTSFALALYAMRLKQAEMQRDMEARAAEKGLVPDGPPS